MNAATTELYPHQREVLRLLNERLSEEALKRRIEKHGCTPVGYIREVAWPGKEGTSRSFTYRPPKTLDEIKAENDGVGFEYVSERIWPVFDPATHRKWALGWQVVQRNGLSIAGVYDTREEAAMSPLFDLDTDVVIPVGDE